MGGRTSRWRRAAERIGFPCGSGSGSFSNNDTVTSSPPIETISCSALSNVTADKGEGETAAEQPNVADDKGLCMICLEPLGSSSDDGKSRCCGNQTIFTAHCAHAFHFACITSNVRHGSVTCPICRAHWSQLPRELMAPVSNDPVLRILDDSIATSRVNRRSFLRSTRYDDDDPVDPEAAAEPGHPRLHFAVVPAPMPAARCVNDCTEPFRHPTSRYQLSGSPMVVAAPTVANQSSCSPVHAQKRVCLSVTVAHQPATDLVLVASPNGPHLRLLKQSMALVVFSLRHVDRLAIITYSNAATRAFPLRRMSAQGKRAALQAIDRLFYLGEAEPTEGLRKGIKILEERAHRNPLACILHLSDSPTSSYVRADLQFPIPVHRFHMGFGFGVSNGLVMHEFEEFLARLLGGVISEVQLKIGEEEEGAGVVRLGELRGGEERRVLLELKACCGVGGRNSDCGLLRIAYSYVDGGGEQRLMTGQTVVGMKDRSGGGGGGLEVVRVNGDDAGGRASCVERWEYLDPFMARRWAKHLHGYKI